MKSLITIAILLGLSNPVFAQENASSDSNIEAEVNAAQGPGEVSQPEESSSTPDEPINLQEEKPSRNSHSLVDEEMKEQEEILRRKETGDEVVSPDRNVNRFPTRPPSFQKPPGPKQGGTLRVEHPRAAKGLLRINKDGSYQYKTAEKEKSHSSSFRVAAITPPQITTDNADLSFESMYGNESIWGIDGDYEWQPFRRYGSLGVKLGIGLGTVTAKGYFKTTSPLRPSNRSQESYTLFIVPLSVFLNYRFEYVRHQWIVPYILGGATYYGLAEVRDDGKSPTFAGSPTIGAGGGLLFSITRLDAGNAFTLSEEYGIADMWFVVEARAMQGLSGDIDFTSQTISAGIAIDF